MPRIIWVEENRIDTFLCVCEPAQGCDAQYSNVVMQYECIDTKCKQTAATCESFADLAVRTKRGGVFGIGSEVLKTSNHGCGVRSCRPWAPSEIIMEYTGECLRASASAFLGTAAYFGASLGGYLIKATENWRWTQYFNSRDPASSRSLLWHEPEGLHPHTRSRSQRRALGEIITVLDSIIGSFTNPVIALSTFFLPFNFAVVFQWFVVVPAALRAAPPMGPGYTIDRIGLTIGLTGTVGSTCAALMSITIEQASSGVLMKTIQKAPTSAIKYRLILAMIGQFPITTSLFWISWTVSPNFSTIVPIVGTAVYIFGNASIIISIIP
ncbi:hypothetical protein LTR56_026519 [Elasticomyces elasticus]|nr:hypothetical protein LTR56_026519 [Elasticomyces elasticus]